MSDKNIYINDILHRRPGHTLTETAVGDMTKVTLKDAGSVIIAEQKKLSVLDAYRLVREDILLAEDRRFLSTTSERDALVNIEQGTPIFNIEMLQEQVFTGSIWLSAGGETGGIVHRAQTIVQTTDNTETVVNTLTLDDDAVYLITAGIVGKKSDLSTRATFIIACTAQRNGGGSASIEGGTSILHTGKGAGAGAWSVDFIVLGNDLCVAVTGQNGMTIDWEASIEYLKF